MFLRKTVQKEKNNACRLTRLHERTLRILQEERNMSRGDEESEEVKAEAVGCSKCLRDIIGGESKIRGEKEVDNFPHIQDLCPADKRRIGLLVKHLAKCIKEKRDAEMQLQVCKAEKEAVQNQYCALLDREKNENNKLQSQIYEKKTEMCEMKVRISQALELLARQMTTQEKQFADLAETVKSLLRERIQLQNTLAQKETCVNNLTAKMQRAEETLEMERLLHSKERAKTLLGLERIHTASQTDGEHSCVNRNIHENIENEPMSYQSRAKKTKSKEDLETFTTDVTLMRDLFFKNPSLNESGSLESIPALLNPHGKLIFKQPYYY